MISIIDYDAGNIKSVENALDYLGKKTVITNDRETILSSSHIILPGVGAFADAMDNIKKYQLENTIIDAIDANIPFLGICMGLQLLFETSEEGKQVPGLGILKGDICKIPQKEGLKIPHMGWNSLTVKPGAKLYQGMKENPYVYFVHSYFLKANNREEVAATSEYGVTLDVSVETGNLFACQFHPEKSGQTGLKILDNFVQLGKGK